MYKLRSGQSQGLFDMISDEDSEALWKEIVETNIFAICRTSIAERITRRTLLGYRQDIKANIKILEDQTSLVMVYKRKLMRTLADGENFWNMNKQKDMKFDAIIGNPP